MIARTVSQDYRAHLLAYEQSAHSGLFLAYTHLQAGLTPHTSLFFRGLKAQMEAAGRLSFVWLHKQLRNLLPLLASHITTFAGAASAHLVPFLHTAGTLGMQNAVAQVEALTGKVVHVASGVLPRVSAALTQVHARLSHLASLTVSRVRQALMSAASLRQSIGAVIRRVGQALRFPWWQSVQTLVTDGWDTYRDTQRDVWGEQGMQTWVWEAHPGACAFCIDQDGTRHPIDEDMDSHPNCRCDCVLVA